VDGTPCSHPGTSAAENPSYIPTGTPLDLLVGMNRSKVAALLRQLADALVEGQESDEPNDLQVARARRILGTTKPRRRPVAPRPLHPESVSDLAQDEADRIVRGQR